MQKFLFYNMEQKREKPTPTRFPAILVATTTAGADLKWAARTLADAILI